MSKRSLRSTLGRAVRKSARGLPLAKVPWHALYGRLLEPERSYTGEDRLESQRTKRWAFMPNRRAIGVKVRVSTGHAPEKKLYITMAWVGNITILPRMATLHFPGVWCYYFSEKSFECGPVHPGICFTFEVENRELQPVKYYVYFEWVYSEISREQRRQERRAAKRIAKGRHIEKERT